MYCWITCLSHVRTRSIIWRCLMMILAFSSLQLVRREAETRSFFVHCFQLQLLKRTVPKNTNRSSNKILSLPLYKLEFVNTRKKIFGLTCCLDHSRNRWWIRRCRRSTRSKIQLLLVHNLCQHLQSIALSISASPAKNKPELQEEKTMIRNSESIWNWEFLLP